MAEVPNNIPSLKYMQSLPYAYYDYFTLFYFCVGQMGHSFPFCGYPNAHVINFAFSPCHVERCLADVWHRAHGSSSSILVLLLSQLRSDLLQLAQKKPTISASDLNVSNLDTE